MVVVIKYKCNFKYPHPFGRTVSIITHRKEVINYPNVNLDDLSNDVRSQFIDYIQQTFDEYGNVFSVYEIRLFKDYSEVK